MITREFDLMLYQEGNLLFINANQYDSGEQWIFTLYEENGVKYTPATGAIVGVKSDGKGIINTGTVDEYGRVVINETQQMTAAAGLATFELLIDNDTHGTANFKVDVEPRPADNADLSDSDLSLIQEAIDAAEVIVEVIGDGDPSEVIGEHVDAWLDNHPEATTTVEDGAITAPKINQSLWDKLLVSESASGAVASFDDGADDVPVSSLKVNLEPIQLGSGDPSPSNIRPIIASNGKNLANVPNATTTQNAVTAVAVDGAVTANGTPSATGYIIIGTAHLTGGVEYTITGCPSGGGSGKYGLNIRDASGTSLATEYGSGATYTPTGDIDVNVCIRYWYNFALNNVEFKPMIRLASITDASYQPYQGITVERTGENVSPVSYPLSLGREVYGGTVDLATGVLTVTHVMWTDSGTGWVMNDNGSFYKSYSPSPTSVQTAEGCACNYAPYTISYSGMAVFARPNGLISLGDGWGSVYANVASLQAAFASTPIQVVYKLANPTTIQLTPTEVKTLLGYNNISSSGTVDVIYHADTKLYVDKMTNVDNNIIAPTEADFVATRNYTVNDLVIVNDTLYKCTANIASGSAITPNSNVQQTTLGALIKALS